MPIPIGVGKTTKSYSTKTFNKEEFLANFQGMEDIAKKAILSFLDNDQEMMSQIHNAIKARDPKGIELAAHKFRGSVSNFQAENCRSLSEELESMGEKNQLTDTEAKFAALSSELSLLKSALLTLLKSKELS